MEISKHTLPIKSRNKSLIESRFFMQRNNLPTVNSEKSITTNESYTLLTEKNNIVHKNKIYKNASNLNSIISPNFITIINNNDHNNRIRLPNPITKLPKISTLQILSDADNLIERRRKRMQGFLPTYIPKNQALHKSNEMGLKNYIIKVIKEKRDEIHNNEKIMIRQYNEKQRSHDNKLRNFLNIVEQNKKNQKIEEEELNELNKIKLQIKEKEVILNNQIEINKKLEEIIKRVLNPILSYIKYGSFIHKVIEKRFIFDELIESDEKDNIKIMEKLIDIYEENIEKNDDEKNQNDFLNKLSEGEELFYNQISNKEEDIRRKLEERKIMYDKIRQLTIENKLKIDKLKLIKKENELNKIIYNENKEQQTNVLNHFIEYDVDEIKRYLKYIIEINNIIRSNKEKIDDINIEINQQSLWYCKDNLNALEEMEYKINNYINEIENIINNGDNNDKLLMEQIINERKIFNKRKKQAEIKRIFQENKIKKIFNTKDIQRIALKGRKVIQDFPLIKNKKKLKKIKIKKHNDDFDYLYYSSDE